MNIRDSIVARRKERIEREGHSLGAEVPRERSVPLVPFLQGPPVICEIKRSSPSKGEIAAGLNAVDQAELYSSQGIRTVSVLTEEEHFSGSLRDLMEVKKRFPRLSVLRKDFLIDSEDLDVSYRAGADAVLLIASLFTPDGFSRMYRYARKLGLECLVEIHSQEDAEIVRNEKPEITGINSRDLTSFRIDPLIPLKIRNCIDWPSRVVFESGIFFCRTGAVCTGERLCGNPCGRSGGPEQNPLPENWFRCSANKILPRRRLIYPLPKAGETAFSGHGSATGSFGMLFPAMNRNRC